MGGEEVSKFSRSSWLCPLLLLIAPALLGQGWPLPAKTPNTDVPCTAGKAAGCKSGLLTKGYPSNPFVTFTGRFLDSNQTTDYQFYFRTGRAYGARAIGNRMYCQIGSSVASYDLSTFFTRLAAGEPLMSAAGVGTNPPNSLFHAPPFEQFLTWDTFFYPEYFPTGWQIARQDGQDRLYGFDVDDQGYLYMAYSIYGWGIVKDPGDKSGLMPNPSTATPPASQVFTPPVSPYQILVTQTSDGHYWAVFSDKISASYASDVTDRANPGASGGPLRAGGIGWFAKTSITGAIGIIDQSGGFHVYSPDALVHSGAATVSSSGAYYLTVATDGTNFYTILGSPTGVGTAISVWSPAGNTYRETRYPIASYNTPLNMQFGAGFLTIGGVDGVRLFKVAGAVPTEIPTTVTFSDGTSMSYFKAYYSAAGAGYAVPPLSHGIDAAVVKSGSHYYLIVANTALGDVYEIKGADTISVSGPTVTGQANPHAPAAAGPFYGDTLQFTANTSASTAVNVNWNYGVTATVDATSSTGVPVTHQYSGLTPANFTTSPSDATKQVWNTTVTATNQNDSQMTGNAAVQLVKPAPRFGINGTTLLFTLPSASSPAPIVAGDQFFDASDGTVQGHFDTWNLDSVTQRTLPTDLVAAGQCGSHTLSYDSHYGPFTGTTGTYSSTTTDFAVGIHGSGYDFNYLSRPFAAAVGVSSSGANVVFSSGSRASSTAMNVDQLAALTWKWEVVNATGSPVLTGPSGTGFSSITGWTVPKSSFTGTGWKAHLVLTSPIAFTGACAGLTTSEAFSPPLNAPDPAITGSCPSGGPLCSYNAAPVSGSSSNPTTDGWQYAWSISPTSGSLVSNASSSTFSPTFTALGTYTISLTVTNNIGLSATTSTTAHITTIPSCPTMTTGSVFISMTGPVSGCSSTAPNCQSGESLSFQTSFYQYNFNCATHTYSWDFGDGGSSTNQNATHPYSAAGTYTVILTVKNPMQTFQTSLTVTVTAGGGGGGGGNGGGGGGNGGGGGGNGGGGGGACPTMAAGNVFMSFTGASSGCSTTSPNCQSGESIGFQTQFWQYNPACATHSYTWSFGDGTSAKSGQSVSHTYSAAGTYVVSLTVQNPYQVFTTQQTITTTGSVGCSTLGASNVGISYSGPSSGCTSAGGTPCNAYESVTLAAVGQAGYNFACGTHSYAWNFGDGSTGTGQSTTHAYNTSGTFTVALTVTPPSGPAVTVNSQITVQPGGGNCPSLTPSSVYILYTNATNTCDPYSQNSTCSVGDPINFDIKASSFSGYNLACGAHTFAWDFGDGSSSTSKNPTHTYAANGPYAVKCKVSNSNSNVTVTLTITIGGAGVVTIPKLDFTVSPMPSVTNGFIFMPVEDPNGIITKWVWDFGDSSTATVTGTTEQPATHVYASGGAHTVSLSGYDDTHGLLVQVTKVIGQSERKRPVHH